MVDHLAPCWHDPALDKRKERKMQFPLRIGEQTILKDPETGEPVTVRLTAGEDGRLTVIVEALPGSPVKVTAPPDADVVYQYKIPDSHAIH